jgi:hypothetical protein
VTSRSGKLTDVHEGCFGRPKVLNLSNTHFGARFWITLARVNSLAIGQSRSARPEHLSDLRSRD